MITLSLIYAIFAVNLVLLGFLVATFVVRRELYWVAELAIEWGLLPMPESLRPSTKMNMLQGGLMVYMGYATMIATAVCIWLRKAKVGTVVATHVHWLTRTLWLTPLVGLAAALISMLTWPAGFAVLLLFPLWVIYRCCKGVVLLLRNRPFASPTALI